MPVYSLGENEAFTIKPPAPDSWQHLFQTTFKKLMYFSPCILWGRGVFTARSRGLVPLARLIAIVGKCPAAGKKAAVSNMDIRESFPDLSPPVPAVGRPIPVPQCRQLTEEQVDHYHMLYTNALEQPFEERKESCGRPASTRSTSVQPWPHPSPPPGLPAPDPRA